MTIAEKYNWSNTYNPFTIEELRQLSAKHGMDIAVIIGLNVKENIYSSVSVGKTLKDANCAAQMIDDIRGFLGVISTGSTLEDRRNEHTD